MIKKWIAGLLTLSLVLGLMTGLTLTASADTPATLPDKEFGATLGLNTGDTTSGIEITDKPVTVKFTAKRTSGTEWYYCPVSFVFSNTVTPGYAYPGSDGYTEYQLLRLDNYGWGSSDSTRSGTLSDGHSWETTDPNYIWTYYNEELDKGTEVITTAVRIENTVYLVMSGAGITLSAYVSVEQGKVAYLGFSGQCCKLSNITVSQSAVADKETTMYCFGLKQANTHGVKITEEPIKITFNAKTYDFSNITRNWYAPYYVLFSGSDEVNGTGYNEYYFCRSDLWGTGKTDITLARTQEPDWDNWIANVKKPQSCEIIAQKMSDGSVVVKFTVNGGISTVTVPNVTDDLYIAVTGELTQITDLVVTHATHDPAKHDAACADDGDCTTPIVCPCGYEVKAAQQHNYTKYAVNPDNSAELVQSCANAGCTKVCGTATVIAPTENLVDDGETSHDASVETTNGWIGDKPLITYTRDGEDTDSTIAAGNYIATITCGNVKAFVPYTVSDHTHDYSYAANGATITETCKVTGCDHEKTATISAPTGTLTADGTTEFAANVVYEEGWAGKKPAIAYTVDTVATTDLTKGGAYEASITVDGMKAHVTYNVHAHNYIYAASGNKITQTCSCGHSATATVNAPTGTLYAGSNHNATVTCDSKWVGEKPTVTHTLGGKTVTATNVVGKYTASITVGDKTASVNFEVIERPADTLPDIGTSAWWTAWSEGIEITTNGIEITFDTKSAGSDNWNGPAYFLYSASEPNKAGNDKDHGPWTAGGYVEHWIQRGDDWGWHLDGDNCNRSQADALAAVGITYTNNSYATDADGDGDVWDDYKSAIQAGAKGKITAKRVGDKVTVTIEIAGVSSTLEAKVESGKTAYLSLTVDNASLTNIEVVALESDNTGDTDTGDTDTGDTDTGDTGTGDTDTGDTGTGDTDTGDTDTGDTAAGNTNSGNTDSGDTDSNGPTNTVLPDVDSPAFWGSHSAGQEITADGFDITFTSTSYADISNNWEGPMYILFAGDEPKVNGAGYTELWVQRGDNYGWIDGKNNLDHMADLNALGITYESSCADWDALWADYVANLKKGCEVKIHAELKDGKAVVTMTVQGLTMTTSVPVPEGKTVYLAVSGEKTKLTDINVKTGDPIAVVFALMVASAAGIVVLKKKKEF